MDQETPSKSPGSQGINKALPSRAHSDSKEPSLTKMPPKAAPHQSQVPSDESEGVLRPWHSYKIDKVNSNYLRFWMMQLAKTNAPHEEIPFRIALINTLLH